MLLKVRYNDKTYGMVDDSILDDLISGDEISAFRRTNGWVTIGRDQVRGVRTERRRKQCLLNIYV